jgi:malate/lactate dehydrogenase
MKKNIAGVIEKIYYRGVNRKKNITRDNRKKKNLSITSWTISFSMVPTNPGAHIKLVVSLPMNGSTIIPSDANSSNRDLRKYLKSLSNCLKYAS